MNSATRAGLKKKKRVQNVKMHKHSVIQMLFISSIYQEDLKSRLPLQKLLKILLKMTQKVGYHFKKCQIYL